LSVALVSVPSLQEQQHSPFLQGEPVTNPPTTEFAMILVWKIILNISVTALVKQEPIPMIVAD
jgi:hypothetical protein